MIVHIKLILPLQADKLPQNLKDYTALGKQQSDVSSVTNSLFSQTGQDKGLDPCCFSKALFTSCECAKMDLCLSLLPSPPRGGGEVLQWLIRKI